MKNKIILLFILLLVSCISFAKHPRTKSFYAAIYIDQNFSRAERQFILNAAKNWECSTNGIVKFDIEGYKQDVLTTDPKKTLLIIYVYPDDNDIIEADKIKHKVDKKRSTVGLYLGDKYSTPEILIVEPRTNYSHFKSIMEHEFGHALGLNHVDSKNTIMFENIDQGAKIITQEDLEQFCQAYECDASKLKPCN